MYGPQNIKNVAQKLFAQSLYYLYIQLTILLIKYVNMSWERFNFLIIVLKVGSHLQLIGYLLFQFKIVCHVIYLSDRSVPTCNETINHWRALLRLLLRPDCLTATRLWNVLLVLTCYWESNSNWKPKYWLKVMKNDWQKRNIYLNIYFVFLYFYTVYR